MTVVSGVLFPPLALMNGFKRGENAILREGRRFVVAVGRDATVKVASTVAAHYVPAVPHRSLTAIQTFYQFSFMASDWN